MCCIPVRCLQCLVITVAVVLIIVGICVIIAASYAKNNEFFLYVGDRDSLFGVGLTFGIVLILICVLGIIGACKRSRCCLAIFAIVVFCVMIVLIALTAVIFIARSNYSDYYESYSCASPNSYIQDLITTQQKGDILCDTCACNYNGPLTGLNISSDGPTAAQGCDAWNGNNNIAALIGAVELVFDCHGICSETGTHQIFYFSNVNNHGGQAENKTCDTEIWHFIKNSTGVAGGIVCAMAVITFLAFIALCSLCCHPQKQEYWDETDRI